MILYDLAGADDNARWSPYCWRVKLALAHKQLPFETMPWRYHQKALLQATGQGAVPVLVDQGRWLSDSWQIARYLDATYPDRPALFPAAGGEPAFELFVKHWIESSVHPLVRPLTFLPMFRRLHPADQDYFRASRERSLGMALEQAHADGPEPLARVRAALAPVRAFLAGRHYLGGAQPSFADHTVLATLLWLENACGIDALAPDDMLVAWRNRLVPLHERAAATPMRPTSQQARTLA